VRYRTWENTQRAAGPERMQGDCSFPAALRPRDQARGSAWKRRPRGNTLFVELGRRLLAHQVFENRLLRVQPILGLVVDQTSWPIDHVVGDFFAAVRRHAVHDPSLWTDFEKR
jgi:hypothetical protein